MKTLYLLRHAKAMAWDGNITDFDRPLVQRGRDDAATLAAHLKADGVLPDRIISSPALRARETAEIFAETLGYAADQIDYRAEIYDENSTEALLKLLHALGESYGKLMLVGHDPAFSELAGYLVRDFALGLPTCGLLCMSLKTRSWRKAEQGSGSLDFFEYPLGKSNQEERYLLARSHLEQKLAAAIHAVLAAGNTEAAPEVEKKTAKTVRKLAQKFLRKARTYRFLPPLR